jgi:hypothetical protein
MLKRLGVRPPELVLLLVVLEVCLVVLIPIQLPSPPEPLVPPVTPGDQPPTSPTTALRTAFDQRFVNPLADWPNNPEATAWFADGAYRLFAREPSRFVAVGAPITQPFHDVVVSARFRKVGGPPGGGYGLIVRDQGPGPRDGISQRGRYYVLESGDRGEVGIWRREDDRWVNLVPWTRSEAVRPGLATNEVAAVAMGQHLILRVNGVRVASAGDAALAAGAVGIFVGGDFNEVSIDRFLVQAPN